MFSDEPAQLNKLEEVNEVDEVNRFSYSCLQNWVMNSTFATSINAIKIIKHSSREKEFAEIQLWFTRGQEGAFTHRF